MKLINKNLLYSSRKNVYYFGLSKKLFFGKCDWSGLWVSDPSRIVILKDCTYDM